MREPDYFPVMAALLKRMTYDEAYAFADGILQHYDGSSYRTGSEVAQERMVKALMAFANDVEDREEI